MTSVAKQLTSRQSNNHTNSSSAGKKKTTLTLLTAAEVLEIPQPTWLVDQQLILGGTSMVSGKPASLKTFWSIGLGLCVSGGIQFHGRTVFTGPVIYVAAEGARGLQKRLLAWMQDNPSVPTNNFYVIGTPVQFTEHAEYLAFVEELRRLDISPALIIIDTLRRCTIGLNENDSRDMNLATDAWARLAADTGAHVMVIHHNSKGGDYSGSTALLTNVDTHLAVERRGTMLTITTVKQRDGEELPPMVFESRQVALPGSGGREHSLVLDLVEQGTTRRGILSDIEYRALRALFESFGTEAVTSAQWRRVAQESQSLPESSFHKARRSLLEVQKAVVLAGGELEGKGTKAAKYQINPEWIPEVKS